MGVISKIPIIIFLILYVCSSIEPPQIIYEIKHPDYEEYKKSNHYKNIGSDSLVSIPKFDFKKLTSSVKYPPFAKQNIIEGRVYIKALIDTTGKALIVLVDSTDSGFLNIGALEAVYNTDYEPAIDIHNNKRSVYISFPVNFKLIDRNEKP